MTSPSPASDRDLLVDAAAEVGALLERGFGNHGDVRSKGAAGPVTDIDMAADALLKERLRAARPNYGWLSEETVDTPERLSHRRAFVVDPLDGTRAFIQGEDDFCTSLAVVEDGQPIAAAIYAPLRKTMYAAARGAGTTCNSAAVRASDRAELEGARLIGKPAMFADRRWNPAWPEVRASHINAIALRLALVAAGDFDGVFALGFKSEWDIAAGALLISEAGGVITDPWGEALRFNQTDPRAPGAVAAGPALHAVLIEQLKNVPHPSRWSA
ncbi:MAG: 3'(2'),5'-bisphosphate nucleotidase CysQ [Caulobacterales bacterium]|jgi:myo-inositol-1(or 4)-monophosphatase